MLGVRCRYAITNVACALASSGVVTEKMSDLRGHMMRGMYTFFASDAIGYVEIKVGYVEIRRVDRCVKIDVGEAL